MKMDQAIKLLQRETAIPEGPEVRRIGDALSSLEGAEIKQGSVITGRYSRGVIHGIEKLQDAKIERVSTKGKLITFHLRHGSEPFTILSTLGMTGWWVILKEKDHEWDAYRRIELQLKDDRIAAFFDPRNFGTFKIVSHAEAKRKQAELGPDIMTDQKLWAALVFPDFLERVQRFAKDQTLAEGLLDQRICSGCGNYIRADAMYLARFSPHRLMVELSEDELKKIWMAMHMIAWCSYLNEPPPIKLSEPLDRVLAAGFVNLCYNQGETPTGSVVQSYKDSNDRTVWWSPSEQI